MIKVFPTIDLITKHVFADSQGDRQELQPAESMDDIGKVPQEFDGEDPVVASMILGQVKLKTVKIDKADRAVLNQTMAKAKATADLDEKIEQARVKAIESSAGESEGAQQKAIDTAVKDVEKSFKSHKSPEEHQAAIDAAVEKATKGNQAAIDAAVKDALAEAAKEDKK